MNQNEKYNEVIVGICHDEEELDRIIRTVDDGREQDAAPKKRVIKPLRCPLKASNHYNYIPRTPKNQHYQRRAY